MEKPELIKYTNELFRLYLLDLMQSKNLRQCDIYKPLGLRKQFINNKLKGYSTQYVTLNSIYLIANHFNFTFDLLKYDRQYKQILKEQNKAQ